MMMMVVVMVVVVDLHGSVSGSELKPKTFSGIRGGV
jgi:hypothetical protein